MQQNPTRNPGEVVDVSISERAAGEDVDADPDAQEAVHGGEEGEEVTIGDPAVEVANVQRRRGRRRWRGNGGMERRHEKGHWSVGREWGEVFGRGERTGNGCLHGIVSEAKGRGWGVFCRGQRVIRFGLGFHTTAGPTL